MAGGIMAEMIRVFPRRTKWTPTDPLAFVGDPPLFVREIVASAWTPVKISVTFTWDRESGNQLAKSWARMFNRVETGGPGWNGAGGEFVPGLFVKEGMVTTSRGCPRSCAFCLVPRREGPIRELQIKDGWDVFDNNLLACSRGHVEAVFEMLGRQKRSAIFSGGLDATLLEAWHIDLLKSIRFKRAYFACDTEAAFEPLERAADLLSDFSREKKYCYVLVGFTQETPQEAEDRLMRVFNLGFMPFSMLYRSPKVGQRMHRDPGWRALIRKWCNPARYKAFMRGTTP